MDIIVGGNAVVGFIIFIILIIIQFIVITKCAERVAEVSARFTLDAMPGKQMSIDADLNQGTITDAEASERRLKIQREADFCWHPDTAIDNIVLPNCDGTINGFADKEELISKIKNPMEDLSAIIFVTENYMTQNYYPEDIVSFELHNPKWKIEEQYKGFQKNSEKENVLECSIGAGTTIKISPDADEWDRFCEGHSDVIDMKEGVYIFTLFERIIETPDIVYIKLVYDSDYWEWFEQREPYEGLINPEHPKKYLLFAVPWRLDECKVPIDYSAYGIDDNPFQKGYLDESGALNIKWRCPNREKGLCDCKIV